MTKKKSVDTIALELACKYIPKRQGTCDCPLDWVQAPCTHNGGKMSYKCQLYLIDHFRAQARKQAGKQRGKK